MTRSDVSELLTLIDRFTDGPDRSRLLADQIEGIVIGCFQDASWFDAASVALAQFSPGGGPHYVDEHALIDELRPVAESLRELLAEHSRDG